LDWSGDEPTQSVAETVTVPLARLDWRGLSADEQANRLQALLQAARARGFDPAHAALMRVVLVRSGERAWRWFWTVHHLVCDGRSFPLVLGEVFARHDAQRAGHDVSLPPAPSFGAHCVIGLRARPTRGRRSGASGWPASSRSRPCRAWPGRRASACSWSARCPAALRCKRWCRRRAGRSTP
jgi:hypothetical protein